jgi:hypothetical protein
VEVAMIKHWQPKMERWSLIADINEIIKDRLKVTEGIQDNTRMTARELELILSALTSHDRGDVSTPGNGND